MTRITTNFVIINFLSLFYFQVGVFSKYRRAHDWHHTTFCNYHFFGHCFGSRLVCLVNTGEHMTGITTQAVRGDESDEISTLHSALT